MIKTIKNIPKRVVSAMKYSLSGLKLSFKHEESIRLETISLILLILILFLVHWPLWKKLSLVAIFLLIPLTELLNSALEDLCDLISPELHPSIKAAKDKGSAAVLVAIVIGLIGLAVLIVCPNTIS
ncbi:MAG: diacylglycerol kinase [Deltaproteobacteria bacterium]|jgi:diacylglycerol kinase (ATP)|nr:diacylglycerol kinase [Deltaproteobacteria bacterium]